MDSESDYYEEVPSEGEKEAIVPPVVNNEPLGVDIPAPGAEPPESPATSPSPVPSEASGPRRVGIEVPLDENMVAPPSPAPVVDSNSDDEALGAEDIQIYSSRSLVGLEMWRDATRQYRGQAGFVYTIPPISARFATFLQSLYGDRWEEYLLSVAGESALFELQAALIGWNSQTFFERRLFLRQMDEWSAEEWKKRLKSPCQKRGLLGNRITCQGQVQVVGRSRPAAFLYRPVPLLVVKNLKLHKLNNVVQTEIARAAVVALLIVEHILPRMP